MFLTVWWVGGVSCRDWPGECALWALCWLLLYLTISCYTFKWRTLWAAGLKVMACVCGNGQV